jgi:hypothetical protein
MRSGKTLGAAALTGGALVILFWVLYLSRVITLEGGDPVIATFEGAFPVADAVLALLLVTAGIGLIRGKPHGLFAFVGAAAMTLYLGILDFTFYSQRGLYTKGDLESAVELAVNLLCLGGGGLGLWFGWRLWRRA